MGARVLRLPALRTCSPRCRAAARFRTGNGSKTRVRPLSIFGRVHDGFATSKKDFFDVEAAIMGGRKYFVSARNIFAFEWRMSNEKEIFLET